MELYEIQAANVTEAQMKSHTEIARVIGANSDWRFDWGGEIFCGGDKVAASIEQAAEAMVELGWIRETRITRFAAWVEMPHSGEDRADALRRYLSQ